MQPNLCAEVRPISLLISLSPGLRCGEETGPALLGQQGKDRVQGAGEAHIEEGVCFIQHERFQLFHVVWYGLIDT